MPSSKLKPRDRPMATFARLSRVWCCSTLAVALGLGDGFGTTQPPGTQSAPNLQQFPPRLFAHRWYPGSGHFLPQQPVWTDGVVGGVWTTVCEQK